MAAAYLEQYFDCVEALPLDLQRCVTELREIERQTQGLSGEIERLRLDFLSAVRSGDGERQMVLFRRLQQCMLDAREVGNTKLEISAQLLDIAGDYTQKLSQRAKDMENHPRAEDPYHSPRYSHNTKGESPLTVLSNCVAESKPATKKNSGTKRPRQVDKSHVHNNEEETSIPAGGTNKDSNSGRGKEANNSSTSSATKPPKKKVKTMKKKSATTTKEKETSSTSAPQVHIPMPDLTSKPLDPNEPTYCLCQQVSFGEMIGCDNDDCPIEWFHFQCVALTSKPKGKWYCPQCSQERRSSRTSK